MTDAFTSASPVYRRAVSFAAKPMPLAAGEVAEFRRPRRWALVRFVWLCAGLFAMVAIWSVTP